MKSTGGRCCSGIAWDDRAGDTLECLKDEPSDALALLAVKGRLDQLRRLYSHVVVALVHIGRSLSYKLHDYMGRQPTIYSQELVSTSSLRASWQALSSIETL